MSLGKMFILLVFIHFGLASEPLMPDYKELSGPSGDSLQLEENLIPQIGSGNDQINQDHCYSGDNIISFETSQISEESFSSSSGEEVKECTSSGDDMQSSGDDVQSSGDTGEEVKKCLSSDDDVQSSGDTGSISGDQSNNINESHGYVILSPKKEIKTEAIDIKIYIDIPSYYPDLPELILCKDNEVFDLENNICRKVFNIPFEKFDNIQLPELNACKDSEVFDQDQMTCHNISINCDNDSLIVLEEDEFERVGNDWVHFHGHLLKVQLNSSEGLPVVCVNYSQNGSVSITTKVFVFVYPTGTDYLTYIGCLLSLIAYSLVLMTIFAFKELQTLSTKILACISFASIGFNALTLLVITGAAGKDAKLCQAVAIGLHFFILGQFTWMTVMCIEMAYTFYLASRLRPVQADAPKKRFYAYSAVSWTLPILFVSGVITANYTNSVLVQYGWNDETENQNCWINDFNSAIVVFIVPIFALTLLQLVLFLIVGVLIYSSHTKKSRDTSSGKSIPYFRILLGLFFATNIMWVFGIVAIWIGLEWAWYPFTILLGSQGLVIFLGFFGTKKVLKLYVSTYTKICNTFRSTNSTSV